MLGGDANVSPLQGLRRLAAAARAPPAAARGAGERTVKTAAAVVLLRHLAAVEAFMAGAGVAAY